MDYIRRHARDPGWAAVIAILALAVALGVGGGALWSADHEYWATVLWVLTALSGGVGAVVALALVNEAPPQRAVPNRREVIRAAHRLSDAILAFEHLGILGGLYVSIGLAEGAPDWQRHADMWKSLHEAATAAMKDFVAESDVVGDWFALAARTFANDCMQNWQREVSHPLPAERYKGITSVRAGLDALVALVNQPPP